MVLDKENTISTYNIFLLAKHVIIKKLILKVIIDSNLSYTHNEHHRSNTNVYRDLSSRC
jgi:hypothetical protein